MALDYHSVLGKIYFLFTINTQATTVLIVLLLCLLLLSFIVSGAEVAFFSLTYKDINLLKTKQSLSYKRIINLLEDPKRLLASLLIANSFINIAIIIISNILIDDLLTFNKNFEWVEFLIKITLVTSVILIFAEIMPKIMASQNNIRFAKEMGPVVEIVHYIFQNISKWLVKYSDIIEKSLSNKSSGSITNEELYHAIDITDTGIGIPESELPHITRLEVHGVDYKSTLKDLLDKLTELHYSRMPVYKDDLDEIVGIIHTKDFLPFIGSELEFDWHEMIRSPYFVHEQKMIEDLLRDFQSKRIHIAVVVDEFGGTSGIVTLEDILEEVIGDIKDEFDDEDSGFKKIDNFNYVFEGRTMINDVCKAMELPVDTFNNVKGESDSLAGLVLELAGEIPHANQIIISGDFEFTVLEVAKTRINKIKITIKPSLSEE